MFETPIIKNHLTLPILREVDLKIKTNPFRDSIYIDGIKFATLLNNIRIPKNNIDYITFGNYKIRCKP